MSAGKYREQVTFQRLGLAGDDGYGNVHQTWADHATVWGDMLELPGREALATGGLEATAQAVLRCRFDAVTGITAADRVVARGFVWAIVAAPAQIGRVNRVAEFRLVRGGAV